MYSEVKFFLIFIPITEGKKGDFSCIRGKDQSVVFPIAPANGCIKRRRRRIHTEQEVLFLQTQVCLPTVLKRMGSSKCICLGKKVKSAGLLAP